MYVTKINSILSIAKVTFGFAGVIDAGRYVGYALVLTKGNISISSEEKNTIRHFLTLIFS